MRGVVQRVNYAKLSIDNKLYSEISKGLIVYLGIGKDDTAKDIQYLSDKILNLRIFEDSDEKLNLSLLDIKGDLLIVSQFTLYGDCRKGRRPSFDSAAKPQDAKVLYEQFVDECTKFIPNTKTGVFQANMTIDYANDGPVTMILDSTKLF
jgi:D-tyrosyl-tRNA(Tyr) deacylase